MVGWSRRGRQRSGSNAPWQGWKKELPEMLLCVLFIACMEGLLLLFLSR